MAPKTHWIQAGECMATLAEKYGLPDWKTIYDDPANADLRKARPNPLVLREGDKVIIPDAPPQSFKKATGQEHVIKLKRPKVMLNVRLQKEDGSPIAGKAFVLHLPDGPLKGTTTGDGLVAQEIPIQVTSLDLEVLMSDDPKGAAWIWNVQVGHLDPVDVLSGVRQRLNNLGFFAGADLEARADDALAYAVRAFQQSAGLDATGALDDATRKKLVDAHGGV
jgi:N-acetylmuramoyl-L-alanine amidase